MNKKQENILKIWVLNQSSHAELNMLQRQSGTSKNGRKSKSWVIKTGLVFLHQRKSVLLQWETAPTFGFQHDMVDLYSLLEHDSRHWCQCLHSRGNAASSHVSQTQGFQTLGRKLWHCMACSKVGICNFYKSDCGNQKLYCRATKEVRCRIYTMNEVEVDRVQHFLGCDFTKVVQD